MLLSPAGDDGRRRRRRRGLSVSRDGGLAGMQRESEQEVELLALNLTMRV